MLQEQNKREYVKTSNSWRFVVFYYSLLSLAQKDTKLALYFNLFYEKVKYWLYFDFFLLGAKMGNICRFSLKNRKKTYFLLKNVLARCFCYGEMLLQ